MCRKLIYLTPLLVVLGFASTGRGAYPVELNKGIVAWWTFDEGTGAVAQDGSGNGNNATLMYGATWTNEPNVAPGKGGHAIRLNGTSAFLRVEHSPSLNVTNAVTFEMWIYYTGTPADGIMVKGAAGDGNAWKNLGIRLDDDPVTYRQLNWRSRGGDTVNALNSGTGIPLAQWTHIAITFDVNAPGNNQKIYINGKLNAENRSANPLTTNTGPVFLGAETYTQPAGRWFFQGMLDEGSLYSRALNPVEIKTIAGVTATTDPTPKNGSTVSSTNVLLEWWQGSNVAYTNGHHVYFSDKIADVNTGAPAADKGLRTDPNYTVSNLLPGATYYWRVDEVNNVHPDKLWRGEVWSFTVATGKAAVPNPYDGAKYVGRTRILSWAPGTGADSHRVYFGIDQTKVAAGASDVSKGTFAEASFNPGALKYDTTYYWRVDELGVGTTKGDIWSFQTTASADPNLVGWWTFDTPGSGSLPVLDVSGNENHGKFINDANLITVNTRPYAGATGILNLNGSDECVYVPYSQMLDVNTAGTIAVWVYGGAGNDAPIRHGGWNASYSFRLDGATTRYIQFRTTGAAPGLVTTSGIAANQWTHIALTFDYGVPSPENNQKIYINGVLNAQNRAATAIAKNLYYVAIGGRESAGGMWGGMMDDVRIYNRALTASEIMVAMTGDPNLATGPKPADRSTPSEEQAIPLSWTPGRNAAQHDVYFGANPGAVQNATPSEPLGVYAVRQSATSYTPSGSLEWGRTYYWRIDEVNDLHVKSPWKGLVWSFTVANFLVVDDFETYTNFSPDRVFQTWIDGFGFSDPAPGNPGNGTGAAVGHDIWSTTSPYYNGNIIETAIIHGGRQSMPVDYNNAKSPYYSETDRTFDSPQDWTRKGIKALTVWFRGNPPVFMESAGKYTMSATGTDIWNTADQFRFASKPMSGDGWIIARVDSVQNTDPWAKAGVMIRETLQPGSTFANLLMAPANGCRFQTRPTTGGTCLSDTTVTTLAAVTTPHWIKLQRVGNVFTAYDSNDPATEGWHALAWGPQTIVMPADVYVGLSLTSHNTTASCVAEFSNVSTSTNVTQAAWTVQAIGATMATTGNSAEQLYVAVQDSSVPAKVKAVYYSNPSATQLSTWQEWNIPLKTFADAGVNLKSVKKMYLGVGDKASPVAGGSGSLYFDDIRLYLPRCLPALGGKPAADVNSDCIVDYRDLDTMANQWLQTIPPATALSTDLNADSKVDLKDFAALAQGWLEEILWP